MKRDDRPFAHNSTLRVAREPMKRGAFKRTGNRLRSKAKGRSALASAYARQFPKCELCPFLEGEHWDAFRLTDSGPCIASEVHHVWTPTRWEEGFANFVHCCGPSHRYAEKHSQFGRLLCLWVKLRNGTFDREVVRRRWRRDPVDSCHAAADGQEFGETDWEPLWLLVKESF